MKDRRIITCPECGDAVKIPLFWILGIEGIFRCGQCGRPFKTGYKMGAALFALALSLSMAAVQLLVYIFSIYSMLLFVLLLIPMWLGLAFLMRKQYMLYKNRNKE